MPFWVPDVSPGRPQPQGLSLAEAPHFPPLPLLPALLPSVQTSCQEPKLRSVAPKVVCGNRCPAHRRSGPCPAPSTEGWACTGPSGPDAGFPQSMRAWVCTNSLTQEMWTQAHTCAHKHVHAQGVTCLLKARPEFRGSSGASRRPKPPHPPLRSPTEWWPRPGPCGRDGRAGLPLVGGPDEQVKVTHLR